LKKIPAGWPSGLCITRPLDSDDPSLEAASVKYSMLSAIPNGDGGKWLSMIGSFGERVEFDRDPGGRGAGDFEVPALKKELSECDGVKGDVAVGTKNGSTTGFVTAVYSAVRTRRGPAGLGMIMTSGMEPGGYDARMDCITSLTGL